MSKNNESLYSRKQTGPNQDRALDDPLKALWVKIHPFTIPSLHALVSDLLDEGRRAIIANVNVNAMNLAWEKPWFRKFLNRSEYVFCDGHGVMLAASILRERIPEKITYAAWFPLFCRFCAEREFSLFLLGARPGVAEKAADRLLAENPTLRIAGIQDGFFDKRTGSTENEAVVKRINEARPDVLLVSLGMPLQEKWLQENWKSLRAGIALTGGACLDYMAGESKRPPRWLTDAGFEWLGRMLYEPSRLWRRYLIGNPKFFWRVWKWRVQKKRPPGDGDQ